MGIYYFTKEVLKGIKEVKGRFWIIAEFRRFQDMCTTHDLGLNPEKTPQQRWNIPFYTDEAEFTPEQHYFLKYVVWKYLMHNNKKNLYLI